MKERREKEEERKWDWDLHPWRGAEAEERFLHLGKLSYQWGNWLGQKRTIWGSGRSVKRPVCGRQDTDGPYHHPACLELGHVSAGVHRGWKLERGDWRANLGRRTTVGCEKTAWGDGREEIHNRECCGGNQDCHGSKATLLSDMQRMELPLQPLSPHVPAPDPQKLGKGPHQGWPSGVCHWALEKSPTRAGSLTSWPLASPCTFRLWGSHDPGSHATSMFCPHWGRHKTASGEDSCVWPTGRGGVKTTAVPQG